METIDCIKSRTCVRSFRNDDVSEEDVSGILEAAIQAPNSGNIQDWRFVVVRNPGNKKRLEQAAFEQKSVDAPVVIVVCTDLREIGDAYGERGEALYSVQNAAAATQSLMLAAWDKGLGSCWVGSFNEKAVRDILVLPDHVRPLAIVPIGYPETKSAKASRKPPQEVIRKDFY